MSDNSGEKFKDLITIPGDCRLGNWLFRVAVGYAYAKEHNKKFVLLKQRQKHFKHFDFFNLFDWLNEFDYLPSKESFINFWFAKHREHDTSKFCTIPAPDNSLMFEIKPSKGYVNSVYLSGYYQCYLHSKKYFKEILSLFLKEPIKKIDNTCSIFVRRGDYLGIIGKDKSFSEVTRQYYQNAIAEVNKKNQGKEILFNVFSDDEGWCRQEFTKDNGFSCKFYFWKNISPEVDLRIAAESEYFILTNSTFAWWAPMLTETIDSRVIAPKNWLSDKLGYHFIYEGLDWCLLEN